MKRLVLSVLLALFAAQRPAAAQQPSPAPITEQVIREAEKLIGLQFTDAERKLILERQSFFQSIEDLRASYDKIRDVELDQDVVPALHFIPEPPAKPLGEATPPRWSSPGTVQRPAKLEEVAYWPLGKLAELVRTRQVSSVDLTRMYLERIKKYDPQLHAVVTLAEELALEQAARADREIAAGRYRGPLHGIPYGAKDLFAHPRFPTTWGATPYKDQVIDQTATVLQRLEEAGAVMVAKVTLGALAWGDVWFGGQTRNPWKLDQGASGSSAGSGSAVSAGLVPFALGSETWGSIVSPASRNGVTGLRPSFGRISRHGAMAVSWSFDKVGPLCRVVEDCAIVFDAIRGPDGRDRSVVDAPFGYRPDLRLETLRIGYLVNDFEQSYPDVEHDRRTLDVLRRLGAQLIPIRLPETYPVSSLTLILSAEAAASHDALTRSGRDDLLSRQLADAWPNVFRTNRLVPAVEYIQANRIRTLVGREMRDLMADIDAYVAPAQFGSNSFLTNLTGHPAVVVPNGFRPDGTPTSITFIGGMYDEAAALAVARAYQEATEFHLRRPPGFP